MSAHLSLHARRKRVTSLCWMVAFYIAMCISIVMLVTLMLRIVNDSFGFVAVKAQKNAQEVLGVPLDDASAEQLRAALQENISKGLYRKLNAEKPIEARNSEDLRDLFRTHVIKERVAIAWSLTQSLTKQKEIRAATQEQGLTLQFRNWIGLRFLISPQSSEADISGIRTALIGSLLIIIIAIVFSVPVGVATALFLEEYAHENRVNRLIQINIYNLAGIPSIVYGLLGLVLFVRMLEPLTQGRTILSAGLTLGLMCLPIIIINSQEAIRAVPNSLRYSSYGLGATKWQMVWHHVLPYSAERILTGVILAISRAVGETAPLVVVGAATFISVDPTGIFSRFTALPIQVYQWASRPQQIYQHTAAAAVVVLIVLIVLLNISLFIVRNHLSKQDKL